MAGQGEEDGARFPDSMMGRKRVSRACKACRASKKRCDYMLPCSNCSKKGMAASCMAAEALGTKKPGTITISGGRTARGAAHEDDGGSESLENTESRSRSPPLLSTRDPVISGRQSDPTEARARGASPSEVENHRMLLGSNGEKVYIGGSAAISFLQFIRKTLTKYSGPSRFTESRNRHAMLEAEPESDVEPFEDFVNPQTKLELIKCFLHASSGFIYVYTEDQISGQMLTGSASRRASSDAPVNPSPRSDDDHAVSLLTMVAIGAQCRASGESDARIARTYFSRAQQLAFRDGLQGPSTVMVVNYMLMAFYLLVSCRRNTSLLYLSTAVKAATILGIHIPESSLPPDAKHLRSRIWQSLRVMDLHCNAVLGRPSSTLGLGSLLSRNCPTQPARPMEGLGHTELALRANYDLCFHLEQISQVITKRSSLDIDTAEEYLQNLRDWARSLPEVLREAIAREPGQRVRDAHRRRTIGNVHVACGYYFGVLLLTRPFLVANVCGRLQRARHGRSTSASTGMNDSGDLKVDDLSQTCLGAAVYLTQMCQDAASVDLLLGGESILQAWLLAAGLALGFSLLPYGKALHPDAQGALASARNVLAILATRSPQAQRNSELLKDFSDAIDQYHAKSAPGEQRPGSSNLLEQIMRPSLPENPITPDTDVAFSSDGNTVMTQGAMGNDTTLISDTLPAGFFSLPDFSFGIGEGMAHDDVDMQQFWDEYLINVTPPYPVQAPPPPW